MVLRLLALFAALTAAGSAAGQETPVIEHTLPDSIVVTASRYPEAARHTGRRVSVWTAQDIKRLPVSSFDDLLRTVAGVDVQSRGGFGIQSDLSIRGAGFNGVLLLLDGAPINDPMTGHFLADLPVPLSEIARVEVLRGPVAAVYGPDAIGGVVQLFTYAGLRDARSSDVGLATSIAAEGGQHELYDVDVSASGSPGGIYVSAASAWQGTDGEPILNESIRTDFRRRVHTAALQHRWGDLDLFARAGWDDREFGAFHFYTPFPSDTAREATSTAWGQLRMRGRRWSAQIHAKQHYDEYIYSPSTPANIHTSRMLNAQIVRTWIPGDEVSLSLMADAGIRGIDSNNLGQHQDASGGAAAAGRWQQGPYAVRAGGRVDYDRGYGVEVTPQIYATYGREAFLLRAGVARSVRAPNYIERYFNTTLASPRGRSLGNPDLQPERAWSFELGGSLMPSDGVALHVTGFRRLTRDLIDYAKLAEADTVYLARNLHRVRTLGMETELEARRSVRGHVITLALAHAFLDADLGSVEDGVDFKYALTHARHLFQASLGGRSGPVDGGIRAVYKEPIDGESYAVVHARAGLTFALGAQRVGVSVELRNVFDRAYTDVFDAPMPGRWWIVGLRFER